MPTKKAPNVTFTGLLTKAVFYVTFSVRKKYEVTALLSILSCVRARLFVAFYLLIRCPVKMFFPGSEIQSVGSRELQRSWGHNIEITKQCEFPGYSALPCAQHKGCFGMLCVPAPGTQGDIQAKEDQQSLSSHERHILTKKKEKKKKVVLVK